MTEKAANFFNLMYSFRGLITWSAVFIVAIIFRIDKRIDGDQFVNLVKGTFIAFSAIHASEGISTTIKEYLNAAGKVIKVDAIPDEGDDIVQKDPT